MVGALAALLTHWRILPFVVRGFGRLLERSFRIGGPVGLASAANVLVGMIEAPLLVRSYLSLLSRSELFVLMATGMATIAGTVYVLYSLVLAPVLPDAASQLLVASVVSAPAAVTVALLMVPPREPPTEGRTEIPRESAGAMDAVVRGTAQGVKVLIAVVALLIVFVALVHLANTVLGLLPDLAGAPLTLQRALSWPLVPVAWLMGIPWEEARTASHLLATKVVLNELVAYLDLAKLPEEALSGRSRLIAVYALCGFANLGSPGHHDRRPVHPRPRAPGRDRGARPEEHRGRVPGHLPHGRGHRHPDAGLLTRLSHQPPAAVQGDANRLYALTPRSRQASPPCTDARSISGFRAAAPGSPRIHQVDGNGQSPRRASAMPTISRKIEPR